MKLWLWTFGFIGGLTGFGLLPASGADQGPCAGAQPLVSYALISLGVTGVAIAVLAPLALAFRRQRLSRGSPDSR